MPFDILLFVMRVGFLVLLYVFLFAVVRVAWRGLRQTAADHAAALPASSAVRLRLLSDGQEADGPTTFDLWSSATIGRAPDNTIVLQHPSVSARHARVQQDRGVWSVDDLRSTNGTAVNDVRIQERTALRPGDVLWLGEVRLRLEVDGPHS